MLKLSTRLRALLYCALNGRNETWKIVLTQLLGFKCTILTCLLLLRPYYQQTPIFTLCDAGNFFLSTSGKKISFQFKVVNP